MKKITVLALVLLLVLISLTACGHKDEDISPEEDISAVEEAVTPEPTALPVIIDRSEELESEAAVSSSEISKEDAILQSLTGNIGDGADASSQSFMVDTDAGDVEAESYSGDMPFASPTPQPNAAITRFAELSGTGLGFKFNYPADWNNLPGRSSVCYMQPITEGTVYPARVSISLKKMSHKCGPKTEQAELVSFLKLIRNQYDSKTFSVTNKLDKNTKFMGNNAISTTYLAYDKEQEIKGYVIMTYFERYIYCFHFMCAYDDYPALVDSMKYMRDSVTVKTEELPQ